MSERVPVEPETIKIALDALRKNFEEGAVFVIIALTPAKHGEYQNWIYTSNAPRKDMIGGLETILNKWKSNN